MKELIMQMPQWWNGYWGTSLFPWLFLAAVAYLFLFHRKEKKIKYILTYTVVSLFLFFFPVSAAVIQKCIGETVYWRVFWLVPFVPVMILAATEFLRRRKGVLQVFCVFLCIGAIAVSGKEFYREGQFSLVHNYQKVPDVVAGLCEMVKADAGEETRYVIAADNYVAPYIRVYDPSIYTLFSRECRGNGKRVVKRLYEQINAPEVLDYNKVGNYGRRSYCNYLVVKIPNEEQKAQLEVYGYQEVGTVDRYSLFRYGDSAEAMINPFFFE